MKSEEQTQLESLLNGLPVSILLLDATHLHIRTINTYARMQLEEPWRSLPLTGQSIKELLPPEAYSIVFPVLQQVVQSKQAASYEAIPYEGVFKSRGRTYWRIHIELLQSPSFPQRSHDNPILCITLEDVTPTVRNRLHMDAIHAITAAGTHTLSTVLDATLDAVHRFVGSTHCAILLVDNVSTNDYKAVSSQRTITVAAYKGLHLSSQEWHPPMNQRLLLAHAEQKQGTLYIEDTKTTPEIDFPALESDGIPHRPGIALCIPIFEPGFISSSSSFDEVQRQRVIGSVEVYHTLPRRFSDDEIDLLEQIAQQAGLAIQNTRLFQNTQQLVRAERRSAHQQAHMMQAIPDGIIIVDPRWRIAETNQAIRQLLGWVQESHELIGLPLADVLQQSDATLPSFLTGMTIEDFELRASSKHTDEFKMLSAYGRSYTMRCTYTPICDDLGDTFAFIITFHDVTEQVAARERIEAEVIARTGELAQRNAALQQAQLAQETERARLESLVEQLPSGIILVSADDASIIHINSYAFELLSRSEIAMNHYIHARQLIGMDARVLFSQITMYDSYGAIVPYGEQPLALALAKGETTELELHVLDRNEDSLYLLANAAPLRALDGTITSAILVLRDITTLKALERARENLFTTMAHELKTPLANVRAHLSAFLLNDIEWSSEEKHDFIQTADEQVERLIGMIHRVLNASRIEAGALHPQLEPVIVSELVDDLQERLAALINSSPQRLEVILDADLPTVEADYELIMSVLINLVSNAFRYAPEGDVVTLEASLAQDDLTLQPQGVTFSVRDNGPGITPEQQQRLFRRFSPFTTSRQLKRPETAQKTMYWSQTSGLGLYISRGIIEAHHSTLALISNPGQGTCFSFMLFLTIHRPLQSQTKKMTVPEAKISTNR